MERAKCCGDCRCMDSRLSCDDLHRIWDSVVQETGSNTPNGGKWNREQKGVPTSASNFQYLGFYAKYSYTSERLSTGFQCLVTLGTLGSHFICHFKCYKSVPLSTTYEFGHTNHTFLAPMKSKIVFWK